MKRTVLWMCVVLAGCNGGYGYRWESSAPLVPAGGTPSGAFRAAGPVNGVAGAILFAVVVADGIRYYLRLPDGTHLPYDGVPDPERAVNVQDCTRSIDLTAGNLMCR